MMCNQQMTGSCSHRGDTHFAPVDDVVPVLPVVIHNIDVIQVGVCPVHQLPDYIQRHGGGQLDSVIHQLCPVGAVHVAALHLGHIPIISEKQHSVEGWRVQWSTLSVGRKKILFCKLDITAVQTFSAHIYSEGDKSTLIYRFETPVLRNPGV